MIVAVLLILEKDGKILFAKRHPKKDSLANRWSLPSEKVRVNEAIFDAARRCAKEELDLEIEIKGILDSYYFKNETEEKSLTFVKANYTGEPVITAEEELTDIEYYTFEEFFAKYPDNEIGHGLQYLRMKFGKFT